MRYFCLFALLLALGLQLTARAQQPFEQFGVKVKILTLSNGRYPEFFDNDSLRRIGTVVYDTRRERVAYLLPPDSLAGRLESDITARWLSPDPLAEEDAYISPYAFARNNALKYVDPDGRKVVFAQGVSAQFRKDFAAAVKYLNAHGAGGMLAELQKSKQTYYVGAPDYSKNQQTSYNTKTRTLLWDPKQGAYTFDKNKIQTSSPAALLNHEADHANQHDKNPQQQAKDGKELDKDYGNKEERRVITGSEQETAKKLGEIEEGEVTRRNHQAVPFETKGPTSREEAKPIVIEGTREKKKQ